MNAPTNGSPPGGGSPGDGSRRPVSRDTPLHSDAIPESVECPFCGQSETEQFSAFGSALSVSQYYCRRCRTVFDAPSLLMVNALTRQLSALAEVRRVVSPSNTSLLVPDENGFAVRRMVEGGELVADLQELSLRARSDPFWLGKLVSRDALAGCAVVQTIDNDAGATALLRRDLRKPWRLDQFS